MADEVMTREEAIFGIAMADERDLLMKAAREVWEERGTRAVLEACAGVAGHYLSGIPDDLQEETLKLFTIAVRAEMAMRAQEEKT
jgi:hypothetical protein